MANQNPRIQHKRGTTEQWKKAVNFTPLDGEIIIYSDVNKIKIGNGKDNVNDLEFAVSAIVDVDALPEENISKENFYRVKLDGSMALVMGGEIAENSEVIITETLPGVGNAFLDEEEWAYTVYYNSSENEIYAYLTEKLAEEISYEPGWYLLSDICELMGATYGGIIENIEQSGDEKTICVLNGASEKIYCHTVKGWICISNEVIGWKGTGKNAEVFNDQRNMAIGDFSHAEGTAYESQYLHTGGWKTFYLQALGEGSHAEGIGTVASGKAAHAEGIIDEYLSSQSGYDGEIYKERLLQASGEASHAEGRGTEASGDYSHAEGVVSVASGEGAHAEGAAQRTNRTGYYGGSLYEGNIASGDGAHAEGAGTEASGYGAHAEGVGLVISNQSGYYDTFERNLASGTGSHAEGLVTAAIGDGSHAEGSNIADLDGKTTSIDFTFVDPYSESGETITRTVHGPRAEGVGAHAEGSNTLAYGYSAHAEGNETMAIGGRSHAEGTRTQALGHRSHAEGCENIASGTNSHVEGHGNEANGYSSHAEGRVTKANGHGSHAEGYGTVARGQAQHVAGAYNIIDPKAGIDDIQAEWKEDMRGEYLQIVGNGDLVQDDNGDIEINGIKYREDRSNAYILDWGGNAWFAGDVYVGSTNGVNKDKGSKKLATEAYVDEKVQNSGGGAVTNLPLESDPALDNLIINDGQAPGKYAIAGGTNDKSLVENIVGETNASYIDIEESKANGDMSIAYGSSNIAHSAASNAFGIKNQAGFLGYYISEISSDKKTLTLSTTQSHTSKPTALILEQWKEGFDVVIINGDLYPYCAKVASVDKDNGTVTFDRKLPFDSIYRPKDSVTGLIPLPELPHDRSIIAIPPIGTKTIGIGSISETFDTYRPGAIGEVELGFSSVTFGFDNAAVGTLSTTFGLHNVAVGTAAFVTGRENVGSFATLVGGYKNKALGSRSFVIGSENVASGVDSSAEGHLTTSSSYASHAEGNTTEAVNEGAHSEGVWTTASGIGAHAEGLGNPEETGGSNIASGNGSHAEGRVTQATASGAHSEGVFTKAVGEGSHAEGKYSEAHGKHSHVEGFTNLAYGENSHAEGEGEQNYYVIKLSSYSSQNFLDPIYYIYEVIAGTKTPAVGDKINVIINEQNHQEITITQISDDFDFDQEQPTLIQKNVLTLDAGYNGLICYNSSTYGAIGKTSHSEGSKTRATGLRSHAEGYLTNASGDTAHAEGSKTKATNICAHSEGYMTEAIGNTSHAEGWQTKAIGKASHAAGMNTIASGEAQTVIGKWNKEDSDKLFIIGNGTGESDRKNIFTVSKNGSIKIKDIIHKEDDYITHEFTTDIQPNKIIVQDNYYPGTGMIIQDGSISYEQFSHPFELNMGPGVGTISFGVNQNGGEGCTHLVSMKATGEKQASGTLSPGFEFTVQETNSDGALISGTEKREAILFAKDFVTQNGVTLNKKIATNLIEDDNIYVGQLFDRFTNKWKSNANYDTVKIPCKAGDTFYHLYQDNIITTGQLTVAYIDETGQSVEQLSELVGAPGFFTVPDHHEITHMYYIMNHAHQSKCAVYKSDSAIKTALPHGITGPVDEFNTVWNGKKWYAYGTSITDTGNVANTGKYTTYIKTLSGMELVNKGLGSQGIADWTMGGYDGDPENPNDGNQGGIYTALMSDDGKAEADLITIEIGANDTGVIAKGFLGNYYDNTDDTYCGRLNKCLQYLQENTTAQILVIGSPFSATNNWKDNYELQKATEECCRYSGVQFLYPNDGVGAARLNATDKKYIVRDHTTIHQSELGGYIYASHIWEKLKTMPLFY